MKKMIDQGTDFQNSRSPIKYQDGRVPQIYVVDCKHDKKGKKKKKSGSSDSNSEDKQEKKQIKKDIKDVKKYLALMKTKAEELPNGIRGWFDYFDQDESDEIELNEFVKMVRYLQIEITDRFGIMIFRLLDRENQGCFNFATLRDILYKIMKPYYKKLVAHERERFRRDGMDIKWPPRKKPEPIIIEKEGKTVIKIKEVIREVPVYIERKVYIPQEIVRPPPQPEKPKLYMPQPKSKPEIKPEPKPVPQ